MPLAEILANIYCADLAIYEGGGGGGSGTIITDLPAATSWTPLDVLVGVDVEDTSESPAGTTKKVTKNVLTGLRADLGTDDTYDGETIAALNAGATISQWQPVYLNSSSLWQLADANGSGTYPARALAITGGTNGNPLTVLSRGIVRNDAWAWTPGGTIWLSETVGTLTQTIPATSGSQVQAVGYALTADVAFFHFNPDYITLT